jgi:hypothetical protein
MVEDNNSLYKIAMDFYKRASEECNDLPLDREFVLKNLVNLRQQEFMDVLVHSINNLPNIYVTRLMLLTINNYLLNFTSLDWVHLHKSVTNIYGINTIFSFYKSYLLLYPNDEILTNSIFKPDYIYLNDEDDFIEENFLRKDIKRLREKMLNLGANHNIFFSDVGMQGR